MQYDLFIEKGQKNIKYWLIVNAHHLFLFTNRASSTVVLCYLLYQHSRINIKTMQLAYFYCNMCTAVKQPGSKENKVPLNGTTYTLLLPITKSLSYLCLMHPRHLLSIAMICKCSVTNRINELYGSRLCISSQSPYLLNKERLFQLGNWISHVLLLHYSLIKVLLK